MKDWLLVLIPALIGLLGTIIAVWAQSRKRETNLARERGSLEQEVQRAYQEMWEKVEQLHISMRVDKLKDKEFHAALQSINTFIIENSLYIDDQDHALVNDYVKAVKAFVEAVREANNAEWEQDLADTGAVPINASEAARVVRESASLYEELRQRLRSQIHAKINGS